MAKKKARASVVSPDPGDELATVGLYFERLELLSALFLKYGREAEKSGTVDELFADIQNGFSVPIWSLMTLRLASLYTVIEGWQRASAADPDVDTLLDADSIIRLRALRDGVFHYGALNNAAVTSVLTDKVMVRWCHQLELAFRRFFEREFPGEAGVSRRFIMSGRDDR